MRKLLAIAASAAVATVALGATSIHPAGAQCPGKDGTLPGSPARAEAYGPFYVDDRDFLDLNENDDAGGLWIYMESGKKPNLQRGGDQIAFTVLANNGVNPNLPRINPVPVPDPRGGKPLITFFPNGALGGSISQAAGSHDDCMQDVKANRDNILF